MKVITPLLALLVTTVSILATSETFEYQSDISRLMNVVVQRLYNDRDVFMRELLSNSNDALEKTRLLSLTDPTLLITAPDLNITVLANQTTNTIIIRDSGVGMTREALINHLGTIARSGTSEFLDKLGEEGATEDGGNLIGQFGLGFYSSFLVADKVTVASKSNDDPLQYVFESDASASGFTIAEDPRGNTLGRGTEITLHIKEDAQEYFEAGKLRALISRNSEYGASPIFVWTETTSEEPVEDLSAVETAVVEENEAEEIKIEIEAEGEEEGEKEVKPIETRTVVTGAWELVNDRAPLWMRDPKEVTEVEYEEFYKGTYKETVAPISWTHFKGDAGSTSFRALIYLPSSMPNDFYSKDYVSLESLKLFVRRVFITSDLGENFLPKYLNWVKVFVDADDLPLNVGRDSLQKSRALNSIKNNLVKRTLDLFASVAKKSPEKYTSLFEKAGVSLKLGAVEDVKNRARIVKLLRFETSASLNLTSLDDVVSRRKKGQDQIFFMAGTGQKKEQLRKSPFVEKLIARGYEVLFFGEPMDEILASTLGSYENMKFQDVAKKGLKFGDEDEDIEAQDEVAELKVLFEPLSAYLMTELSASISEVIISTKLTTSPCLVVTDSYAWTANMERLMAAQNSGAGDNFMANYMKGQKKSFEINPKHPLIEALLEKVEAADGDEAELSEIRETVQVLWQTALVRSGFTVPDPNEYFSQVEALLRKALGVSNSATVRDIDSIKPAPAVDDSPVRPEDPEFDPKAEEEAKISKFDNPDEWANWADIKKKLAKDEVPLPAAGAGEGLSGGDATEITEPIVEIIKEQEVETVVELPVVGQEAVHDEL